ncbi:hypothetical protein CO705_19160 [Ralstonia pickettii]|nr:hypothetical protein CO705_19160 [Ralstonia pickettii]
MLERQPDEVMRATLWELEASVSAALPKGALVESTVSRCGGYDVCATWSMRSFRADSPLGTLRIHFSEAEAKTYCRWNHPMREAACRRLSGWLGIQLELADGRGSPHLGYDLALTAPAAFFLDAGDAIHVDRHDRSHDFALYRPPAGGHWREW